MKVKFLKDGNYCIDPARGPLVHCEESKIEDLPEEHAEVLIEVGWAEEVTDKQKEEETEDESEGEEPDESEEKEEVEEEEGEEEEENESETLQVYVESLSKDLSEDEKKKMIQDWGVVNFDHKVSRSKSLENMILELQEIEDNLEEDEE